MQIRCRAVNAPETSKQVENDLKSAGEAITDGQLEVYVAIPQKKWKITTMHLTLRVTPRAQLQ